ncbi:MAG TPA: MarR family winged helix-turn-helix transcriptional regulator [Cellulomonas sp.]|uniref:MarR family winged helix-turn-helix transcriptional regulator n=1 Tax=Cellulomonas sp. TaxID=40001 RepID=UPI002E317ECD|nr:MarR family winged helix-turn-helix transcriptional regulator [Cellulomonas sp.]HEX5331824.1 MarR family winged helix-turn-helix transcriptional regulator [Cellulomonas sp.]
MRALATSQALARHGLPLAQYQALSAVVDAYSEAGIGPEHDILTRSHAMDVLLRDLETRGLIDRTPWQRHGKQVRVRPTDAGLRVAQLVTNALDAVHQHPADG